MGLRAVTQEDRIEFQEFMKSNPSVAEALPTKLPNGMKATSFSLGCPKCEKDLPPEQIWLKITRAEFGSNVVDTWEAKGFCMDCVTMTKAYKRYRSNGSFDFIDGHQWRRGKIVVPETGVKATLQNLMGKLRKH